MGVREAVRFSESESFDWKHWHKDDLPDFWFGFWRWVITRAAITHRQNRANRNPKISPNWMVLGWFVMCILLLFCLFVGIYCCWNIFMIIPRNKSLYVLILSFGGAREQLALFHLLRNWFQVLPKDVSSFLIGSISHPIRRRLWSEFSRLSKWIRKTITYCFR